MPEIQTYSGDKISQCFGARSSPTPSRQPLFETSDLGPFRISGLIPQYFSHITEVKLTAPIKSLRVFWCNRWCALFLRRTRPEDAIFLGDYAFQLARNWWAPRMLRSGGVLVEVFFLKTVV